MSATRENALLPTQAIRLCALGTLLADGPIDYATLAGRIRALTGNQLGPAPTVTASSVELLRYEGLVLAIGLDDPTLPAGPETPLQITEDGKHAFAELMAGGLTTPMNELNRLVVQLRLAFSHLLEGAQRDSVRLALIALYEREVDRISAIYDEVGQRPGPLGAWLRLDLEHAMDRLAWLRRAPSAHRWAKGHSHMVERTE